MAASTAPKKAKKTRAPLKFEAVKAPERTHVLFVWGDKEFLVPEAEDISPNVMLAAVEDMNVNPMLGISNIYRSLFGDEQYAEFLKLNITAEAHKQISERAMEHLTSTEIEEEVEEGKA